MKVHDQLPLVVVDNDLKANDDEANNADEERYVTCVNPNLVITHRLVFVAKI